MYIVLQSAAPNHFGRPEAGSDGFFCYESVRKTAKKSYFLNDRAIKRGEGVKGGPLRKKKNYFFNFFKNFVAILINLSKYGHIMLKFIGRYFYLVVQKLGEEKTVKIRFRLLKVKKKQKKNSEELFLRLPLLSCFFIKHVW